MYLLITMSELSGFLIAGLQKVWPIGPAIVTGGRGVEHIFII